jgi:hypothetical protein
VQLVHHQVLGLEERLLLAVCKAPRGARESNLTLPFGSSILLLSDFHAKQPTNNLVKQNEMNAKDKTSMLVTRKYC